MIATLERDWQEANREYLRAALSPLCELLERRFASSSGEPTRAASDGEVDERLRAIAAAMPAPPALEVLCDLFSLSDFERDVLLLCAAVELDDSVVAALPDGLPTFGLALAVLPQPHWSALTPTRPLRRWRLIDVVGGRSLITSPLRVDERVLHFLSGVDCMDERLFGLLRPLPPGPEAELPESQRAVAARIGALWSDSQLEPWPVIELDGRDHAAKLAVAAAAGDRLGLRVSELRATDIPTAAGERDALSMLTQREAALADLAIVLDLAGVEPSGPQRGAVQAFVDDLRCRLLLAGDEPLLTSRVPIHRLEIAPPTLAEQRRLWRELLGEAATSLDAEVDQVLAQFRLDTRGVEAAAVAVRAERHGEAGREDVLWQACRLQARTRLGDLAQRIEPLATWPNLVLPEPQLQLLRGLAAQMRQRTRVYDDWGFAAACNRGLGISALFAGPSGTGKTMAAEVLANELRLDLYRIDLSQVVSKYIGETEKNLRRVFDAAERAGAILLFDEADALFGKRSEVRDSHDRYANIEVSYLLQRMEAYRGIAILTTNLKDALDKAFLRRIRFIVQFPFPDAAQRSRIWAGIFPAATPTEGLDVERLAQLNVAGGNIRNIAMNAAFLAADGGESVGPAHVLRAARQEYGKVEKTISEAELRGWV